MHVTGVTTPGWQVWMYSHLCTLNNVRTVAEFFSLLFGKDSKHCHPFSDFQWLCLLENKSVSAKPLNSSKMSLDFADCVLRMDMNTSEAILATTSHATN